MSKKIYKINFRFPPYGKTASRRRALETERFLKEGGRGKPCDRKLVVILGPTASGKSELAIKLAREFNGEVVSADSRQVYEGMDIGTAKLTPDTKNSSNFSTGQTKKKYIFTHKGIPHYCIDVVSPKRRFTVAQYRKLALKAINKIFKKNKLPVLCGGSGFYIQAVVDGISIPPVGPDWRLRSNLNQSSTKELFERLEKFDPGRAKTIERQNRRRLIRALEIVIKTKKPVPALKKSPLPYPVLMIGVKLAKEKLRQRIEKRVEEMFQLGLEKEVEKLIKKYGWSLPLQTIGYREWSSSVKTPEDKKRIKKIIIQHTFQYTKRQMTWLKRDKRIKWVKTQKETEKLVKKFLEKK